LFLGLMTFAGAAVTAARSLAAGNDGHAAGYDVAPSSEFVPVIPRRKGDPVKFTASLDNGPLKATSGGWARDVTTRSLPIATGIAGAHLYLNAGGVREMHWHNSDEWAFILDGGCQVTVVDPEGQTEVANYGAGDLWYFPKGHAHAIQALGSEPCHAVLAFNDGLYGEHGTFGLSDWISRLEPSLLSQATGLPSAVVAAIPPGEVYIRQGDVISRDSAEGRALQVLDHKRTHRYRLMAQSPRVSVPGGTIHVASAKEFPMSAAMTAVVTRLKLGAIHAPHWHPTANEWHYVAKGRTRVTLFPLDKQTAVAELAPGDCAYIPMGCGHVVENIGAEPCEIVGVLDSGSYSEAALHDWVAKAPHQLLANNLGVPADAFRSLGKSNPIIVSGPRPGWPLHAGQARG
jgi:oxalate decarboxylase